MKKHLPAFLLLLSAALLEAQPYHPLLDSINQWTYTGNYMPVRLADQTQSNCGYFSNMPMTTSRHFTGSDTVINNLTYKKLYYTNMSPCFYGFVREDTALRKVYFLDNLNSPEIVLYDFSMIPGNTISINFINNGNSGGFYNSGTYLLDSIRLKAVHHAVGMRRIFYLHCTTNPGQHYLQWVEGIGNFMHLVYPYSDNVQSTGWFGACWPGQQYEFDQFLTCFDHNQKEYYDSCAYQVAIAGGCVYYQDTCDYWNICSAVNENSFGGRITLSPNPANDKINIEWTVAREGELEIDILDISGKEVMRIPFAGRIAAGNGDKTIDVSLLADGTYMVRCRLNDEIIHRKLVVKH